ncbi:MAG TPA: hypothetical protein VGN07_06125 [Steroidobacteraceae bacterium]
MNRYRKSALLMLIAVASATSVIAQTPPADPTAPSAASSPHQRDSTATPAAEGPAATNPDPAAAATPHQKQVTEGADKSKHKQMMKDCMAKEQAKNSALSKDEVKKACMDQMKMQSSQAK